MKLIYQIIDECTETIEKVKLAEITLAKNENENKYSSCTVYIVLQLLPELLIILFLTIGL